MARLQAEIEREDVRREAAPVLWRVRRWAITLGVAGTLFIIVLPLIGGEGAEAFDPARPRLWIRIAGAVIFAGASMWNQDRGWKRARSAADNPAPIAAEELERQLEKLRGVGWVRRTVRLGTIMGLAIGVPIGLLLAAIPLPVIEQAGLWGRIGMAGMFVGATLLWTIPMAFGIRWLSLFSMKKYLVQP